MRGGRTRGRPSADRWVVPYADFLTLLLALFVVLYASSAVDAERFQDLAEGVRERFGALTREAPPLPIPLDRPLETTAARDEQRERLETLGEELERRFEPLASREIPRDALDTKVSARGLVVSLDPHVLFDRRGALRSSAGPIVQELAATLRGQVGRVRIEAHEPGGAASEPVFAAALRRASLLGRKLVESRFPASQLSLAAYVDPGGKARIAVVVLSDAGRRAEPGASQRGEAVRRLLDELGPAPERD
ncbi:MAG: flagellar motor protein MotB [Myxococcota bacterium]|nr:flagellar motor protein MotB [Myxococcota bacterium]